MGKAWAPPGTGTNRAPAMPSASRCPLSSGRIRSSLSVEDKRRRLDLGQPGTRVVSAGGRMLAVVGAWIEPAGQPVSDVLTDK